MNILVAFIFGILMGVTQQKDRTKTNTQESAKCEDSPLKSVLVAEVRFPPENERERHANDRKQYSLQKSLVIATWLTFGAVFIYAGITACQWQELKRTNEVAIEAQSPLVYANSTYLVLKSKAFDSKRQELTIASKYRADLKQNINGIDESYVIVNFENFGQRSAIVYGMDVEWKIMPTSQALPESPVFAHPRIYQFPIRSQQPQAIFDNHYPLRKLSTEDIDDIVHHRKSLWVYGFVYTEIFAKRFQEIRFCGQWYGWDPADIGEGFSLKGCPAEYNCFADYTPQRKLTRDWFDTPIQEEKAQHCHGKG